MILTGKQIRELRLSAGFTQSALAAELHITNVYLNKIENDKVAGTVTRIKIEEYFNRKTTIPTVS